MQRDPKDYQAHTTQAAASETPLSLRKKAHEQDRAGRIEFYRRRTTPIQHAIALADVVASSSSMDIAPIAASAGVVSIVVTDLDGLQSTVARIRDNLFDNEQLMRYARRECHINIPAAPASHGAVGLDAARDVVQFEAIFALQNRCADPTLWQAAADDDNAPVLQVAQCASDVLNTTRMPLTERYCVSALANLAAHSSAVREFLFADDRLTSVVRHIANAPDDVLWLLSNMATSETDSYKLARLVPTVVAHLNTSRECWWTVYNLCTSHASLAHSFQQAAIFDTALRVLDMHAETRSNGDSAVVFLALSAIVLGGHALPAEPALRSIAQKHVIERFLVNAPQLNDTGIEQACGFLVALARRNLFGEYAAQVYSVFLDRDVRRAALHVRELFACIFLFAAQREHSRDALDAMCCVLDGLITRASEQDTHTLLSIVCAFYDHLLADDDDKCAEYRKVLEENAVVDVLEPLIERIGKATDSSPRVWRDIRSYACDVVNMLNSEPSDDITTTEAENVDVDVDVDADAMM